MATVFTDSPEFPSFAALSADFVYARPMRSRADLANGYPPEALRAWAARAWAWRRGEPSQELPHADATVATTAPREVFVHSISAAKQRNPAAAMALSEALEADAAQG